MGVIGFNIIFDWLFGIGEITIGEYIDESNFEYVDEYSITYTDENGV